MSLKTLRYITTLAMVLALVVVMLGAYTRLTDAGLGCPDWPGCYGHMVLPSVGKALTNAQQHYPQIPIESRKAWTEMAHRYAAGTLAFLILALVLSAFRARLRHQICPLMLPVILLLLVIFQAALGMWTVTLKLLPVVVVGHLLGGMLIFASLCYFRLQISTVSSQYLPRWGLYIGIGLALVFCQIALGGWVSSNYAGIACIGFPRCNGVWLPSLNFSKGFNLFSPVGLNYQGGLLDSDYRMTIQFIHRVGAVVVASYVSILSIMIILRVKSLLLRRLAMVALCLVIVQFVLGIMNVVYLLPLWVAVAHNGVAALLLATMFLATGGARHVRQC